MPERNRVTPYGEIIVANERGMFMGNRGCLHRGHDIVRPWNGKRWITCVLEFRGRRAPRWEPGRYTALFFYDEAVAFAAGHRPCAECRHADYERYRDAWESASRQTAVGRRHGRRLHDDRLEGREKRLHEGPGTICRTGRSSISTARLRSSRATSCATGHPRPATARPCAPPTTGTAIVITPASNVESPRRIRRRRQPCGIWDMNWFRSK